MYVFGLSALYLKWIFLSLVCAENEKQYIIICGHLRHMQFYMCIGDGGTYDTCKQWYGMVVPYHT